MNINETYPYPDDHIISKPTQPLFEIEVQMDKDHSDFRVAMVCFRCFHKLDPDMWISQSMWEGLNPITKDLPKQAFNSDE